jgi:triosephosphate isomerase
MRKPMVAGNWKMHGARNEVNSLVEAIKDFPAHSIDVVIFPATIHIPQVEQLLKGTNIAWGAQNIYIDKSGAYTGEISAQMLTDFNCRSVLIGHSERRMIFKEDLNLIAEKFKFALQANLSPILCVGETLEQRNQGLTQKIIQEQLQSVIDQAGIDSFKQAVVAYEPVWAIGTGQTATPEQAQEIHAFIRQLIKKQSENIAESLRILYGGSVKADNAEGLFAMQDIDGGLVGGASLNAESFLAICRAAEQRKVEV